MHKVLTRTGVGMAGLRWVQTITGLSSTFGYPMSIPDLMVSPFNIGVACVMNSTSAITSYNIEHTFDFTGTSTFISSNATWFQNSTISAASSNLTGNYSFPVTAIRPNVTAGSSVGTLTVTLQQAGI
jgi:hypothetical protein